MDETQGVLFLYFFSYFFAPSEPDNCKRPSCFIELIDTNTGTELNLFRTRANSIIKKLWCKEDNLPPPQARAHTWDGSYPINQSDEQMDQLNNCADGWIRQRSEPVRIISKKHQKLFGNKKRILQKLFGNKILHKILGKPHSYIQIVYNHASKTDSFNPNRYIESTQTTVTNAIIGYPVVTTSKTPTSHSHEDMSMWDALLVYDTYGLGKKIFERYKRIPLRYGWLFGCN